MPPNFFFIFVTKLSFTFFSHLPPPSQPTPTPSSPPPFSLLFSSYLVHYIQTEKRFENCHLMQSVFFLSMVIVVMCVKDGRSVRNSTQLNSSYHSSHYLSFASLFSTTNTDEDASSVLFNVQQAHLPLPTRVFFFLLEH